LLVGAVASLHTLCKDQGKCLISLIKSKHEVNVARNQKLKDICSFIEKKLEEYFFSVWKNQKATQFDKLPLIAALLCPKTWSMTYDSENQLNSLITSQFLTI
jgi:hypothetical protein